MFLIKLLASPVTAPLNGVLWLSEKIAEQAEAEYYNEDLVRGKLLQLELAYDMDEISEEEYYEQEEQLLARLREIQAWKAEQGR